jgi:hypothetical protein
MMYPAGKREVIPVFLSKQSKSRYKITKETN